MSSKPHVQLRDIALVLAGQSPPGSTYNTEGNGLPFFQGKADFGPVSPIPRVYTTQPERLAIPGDILISVRAPIGSRNIADRKCAIGRGLNAVRAGSDVIAAYLHLVLEHLEPTLISRGSGSIFSAVSREEVETLVLPLPSLGEQHSIVGRIDAVRAQTRTLNLSLRHQLNDLKSYRIQLISKLFGVENPPVGFGPDAPKSYVPLLDLARLETGHTPSRGRADWWGGKIPWLALPDVRAVDGKYIYKTLETTNHDGLANSSARLLPEGSVALSRTASVGFVTILGCDMAVSQDFAVWICDERLDPNYLMAALRMSRDHLLTASSGSIHKTIYMSHLKSFKIHLPTIAIQREIVRKIANMTEEAERMQRAIEAQLRDLASLDQVALREALA